MVFGRIGLFKIAQIHEYAPIAISDTTILNTNAAK